MKDVLLEIALNSATSFYQSKSRNFIIALQKGEKCFIIKCYDLTCGCECTSSCDLEEGELLSSVYEDVTEINHVEFEEKWIGCNNK